LLAPHNFVKNESTLVEEMLGPLVVGPARHAAALVLFPFEKGVVAATAASVDIEDYRSGRKGLVLSYGVWLALGAVMRHWCPFAAANRVMTTYVQEVSGATRAVDGIGALAAELQRTHLHDEAYLPERFTCSLMTRLEVEFGPLGRRVPWRKRVSIGFNRQLSYLRRGQVIPVAGGTDLDQYWGYVDLVFLMRGMWPDSEELDPLILLYRDSGVPWRGLVAVAQMCRGKGRTRTETASLLEQAARASDCIGHDNEQPAITIHGTQRRILLPPWHGPRLVSDLGDIGDKHRFGDVVKGLGPRRNSAWRRR
jgi:hypothetical protein